MAAVSGIVIEKKSSQPPVTALAFLPLATPSDPYHILLSGQDTRLLFHKISLAGSPVPREEKLFHSLSIFQDQPVQGISVQDESILVWGGSCLALVSMKGQQLVHGTHVEHGAAVGVCKANAPDWIHDARTSPFDPARGAVITAHNEIIPVTFPSESPGEIVLGSPVSPSRLILYSGTLKHRSPTEILAVGGTAFGEILVWKCHPSNGQHEMLCVLLGHEGSVFGLDLWTHAPEAQCTDSSSKVLLASCSDDRTVRIWDLAHRAVEPSSPPKLDRVRETGFGSLPLANEEGRESRLVAMGMGHVSRIWGVKFAQWPSLGAQDSVHVFSFGEDGVVQKWMAALADSPDAKLRPLESFPCHDGKNIWSSAVTIYGKQSVVVSGGADGKISQINDAHHPLLGMEEEEAAMPLPVNQVKNIDVQDIFDSMAAGGSLLRAGSEIMKRFAFISETVMLVTTSTGKMLTATFGDESLRWRQVQVSHSMQEDLRLCYVMQAVGRDAAVLGTSSGKLYWYSGQDGTTCLVTSLPWKIVEICHLQNHGSGAHPGAASTELIIYLHGRADGHYLSIQCATGKLEHQHELEGLDPRFRTTSALKMGPLLFLGSRHGWLSVLGPRDGERDSPFAQVTSLGPPSRDAITSITPLPPGPSSSAVQTLSYLLLTTRDGKYRIYSVNLARLATQPLQLVLEASLPFGPFVEGAWFTSGPAPHLVLYGFKHKYFIVWNETLREEIACIDCGGAHREFSFAPGQKQGPEPRGWDGSLRFACTKTSSLALYHQLQRKTTVVQSGIHGREIRTVGCSGSYVATGAEDCSIRIWRIDESIQGRLRYLASMKRHIAGIQRLRWFDDKYLLSSAGNEDLFVWRVERIEAGYEVLGTVCEGAFADKSADGDLRIMDFDASPYSEHADDAGMIISMGFSDSSLKTYRYTHDGMFHPLARGRYTGACVTQLRHLGWSHHELQILTAATDGHLALWRARLGTTEDCAELVLQQTLSLHQSTIKCLDLKRDGDGLRVVTGGDDNAVGTALVQTGQDGVHLRISQRGITRRAHAAAINGVVFLSLAGDSVAATVSNDQRIKLWQLDAAKDGLSVRLLENVYSGIADVGDVDFCVTDKQSITLIVGGVGMEMWKLHG